MSDYYDFVDIITNNDQECIWLNTENLYEPKCIDLDTITYNHTIEMKYLLTLNFNSTNDCLIYFSDDTTATTETIIDGIFFVSLAQWIQNGLKSVTDSNDSETSDFIIQNINQDSSKHVSIEYDCDNYELDIYDVIAVQFHVEALTPNVSDIIPLLEEHTEFYNLSAMLFKMYFDGIINLGVPSNAPVESKEKWWIQAWVWIFFGAVAIGIGLLCCIGIAFYRQKIVQRGTSQYNGLIIDHLRIREFDLDDGDMNPHGYLYDDEEDATEALTVH